MDNTPTSTPAPTPALTPASRYAPPGPSPSQPAGQPGQRRARAAIAAATLIGTLAGCSATSTAASQETRGPAGAGRACPAPRHHSDDHSRELRGVWVATVRNIDWPPRPGLSPKRQRAAYRAILDAAAARHINAVFVQVRPTSDAFYRSPYEPWSKWLTGRQGRDPGYDPLRFLVDEAHARGMEFHAWFNPYRVGDRRDRKKLAANHPARRNPGWVRSYGKHLWYDPGLPEVRDLAKKVVLDVVGKYDVDGVHFDDYFYPYPESGEKFGDQQTFKRYGSGFTDKGDWRRHNVNALVGELSGDIHRAKPWVRFGISPFGVWRNARSDPAGSPTRALQSYDDIYADTRMWMTKGWLDYVAPQLYWHIGFAAADYTKLAGWWARLAEQTKVSLYTGQAAYRVGQSTPWKDPAELARHVGVDRKHSAINGQVYFSAKNLVRNTRGFADRLTKDRYQRPALIPVMPRMPGRAPAPVTGVEATPKGEGVRVRWRGSAAAAYAIYRLDGRAASCAAITGRHLVGVRPGTGKPGTHEFDDGDAKAGHTYTYAVTAVDRGHQESGASRGVTVSIQGG